MAPRSQRVVAATLLALASSQTACSFAFVTPARDSSPHLGAPAQCTKSRVAPVADLAATAGLGTLAVAAFSTAGDCGRETPQTFCSAGRVGASAVGAVALVAAAATLASSIYGLAQTSKCEQVHEAALREGDAAPVQFLVPVHERR